MAPPKTANATRGTIHGTSAHSIVSFKIRAVPLPSKVTEFLQANQSVIKRLERERLQAETQESLIVSNDEEENMISTTTAEGDLIQKPTVRAEDFWEALDQLLDKLGGEWKVSGKRIWAFGPNGSGPNLLLDSRADSDGRYDSGTPKRVHADDW
jgi:ribosome assembly protein 1